MTFCVPIKRHMILHSVCVSFIFAALRSVTQTVTFLKAAGSTHPAQRLQWRPRGPAVKIHYHQTWKFAATHTCTQKESRSAGFPNLLSQMLFVKWFFTKIVDRSISRRLHFYFLPSQRKQLFTSTHCPWFVSCFFPLPAWIIQEASQRRTRLCVTIMASAARRKCSG